MLSFTILTLTLLSTAAPAAAISLDAPCFGLQPQESVKNFMGATIDYNYAVKYCCQQDDPFRVRFLDHGYFFDDYFEPKGYLDEPQVDLFGHLDDLSNGTTTITFYDSVCGIPLFVAPKNRTFEEFIQESKREGHLMFNLQEVVAENVVIADGSKSRFWESKCNTFLGTAVCLNKVCDWPDEYRIKINLVCVAGDPSSIANDFVDPNIIIPEVLGDGSNYTSNYSNIEITETGGLLKKYGIVPPLPMKLIGVAMVGCFLFLVGFATCLYWCKRPAATILTAAQNSHDRSVFRYLVTYILVLVLAMSNLVIWFVVRNNVYFDIRYILVASYGTWLLVGILDYFCVDKTESEANDKLIEAIYDNTSYQNEPNVSIEVTDRHQDFATPTKVTLILAFTQFYLVFYYVIAIFYQLLLRDGIDCDSAGSFLSCRFDIFYYSGMLATFGYLVGTDKFETPVKTWKFWKLIYRIESRSWVEGGTVTYHTDSKLSERRYIRCIELTLRCFFSQAVNILALFFFVIIIPLQVSLISFENTIHEIFVDFVFNLVAGFFILEMDNMSAQINDIIYIPANPAAFKSTNALKLAKEAANVTKQALVHVEASASAVKAAADDVANTAALGATTTATSATSIPAKGAALGAATISSLAVRRGEISVGLLKTADVAINDAKVCVAGGTETPTNISDVYGAIALITSARKDSKKMMDMIVDIVIIAADAVNEAAAISTPTAARRASKTSSAIVSASAAAAAVGPRISYSTNVTMEQKEMQAAVRTMREDAANIDANLNEIATATIEAAEKTVIAAKTINFAVCPM